MFFLEQIKQQFILTLAAQNGEGAAAIDNHFAANDVTVPTTETTNEQQGLQTAETLAFQELDDELKDLDIISPIVNTYTNILGNFLVRVKRGDFEGLSEDDSDFQRLLKIYEHKFEELKDMRNRGQEIEHVIAHSMNQLQETVGRGAAGEDIDDAIDEAYEDNEKQEEVNEKLDKIAALQSLYDSNIASLDERIVGIGLSVNHNSDFDLSLQAKELITEIKKGKEIDSILTLEEQIKAHQERNDEILGLIKNIDEQVNSELNNPDKTETKYTSENVSEMREKQEKQISDFRASFFTFLGEQDSGKKLFEYIEHEKVKDVFQLSEEDDLKLGYDLKEVLVRFDEFSLESPTEPLGLQEQGRILSKAINGLDRVTISLNIILRDSEKVEGEKTLREVRQSSGNEAYDEILKDDALKDALTDVSGSMPDFGDLNMMHISILRKEGYDLKKLFLVSADGKSFTGGEITQGDEYIVNIGVNPDLDIDLALSYLDVSIGKYNVDGKDVEFKKDGVLKPGYYEVGTSRIINIQDGSFIKAISEKQELSVSETSDIEKQITESISNEGDKAVARQIYTESLYNNPSSVIDGSTIPKSIFAKWIAILLNIFDGRNFELDEATGNWVEKVNGGTPQTYGEYRETYEGTSLELGSLSKEFESGSKGVYAYVADDNGAGPSYGTYQMNTDKGVYKEFAALHSIAPGQEGWNAKISEVGKDKFAEMEHQFIKEKNYDPMMNHITIPGKDDFSATMKNVIWSSAVQHGPHRKVIYEAINNSGVTPGDFEGERKLINQIYDIRGTLWAAGINTRYRKERSMALGSLSMEKNGGTQFSSASEALAQYEGRDVTQSIRDINALESGFKTKVTNWLSQVKAAGINIEISETLRTQSRQDYLYEQGRTRPGDIVTWTRNSNHKTGQAIDIFFDPDTHGSMYPPIGSEPWTTTARLARENGIDWGQDLWGKDGAHFQDNSL